MTRARTLTPDARRLGAIIARLRMQRGWTIARLARRAGMHATYLGLVEKGENLPSLTMLFELAEVLGVEAAEIVRQLEAARKPPPLAPPPQAEPDP